MSMTRLPHTLTVVDAVPASDAYGVSRLTYPGAGVELAAFVQPQASEEDTTGRVLTRLKVYTLEPVAVTARVTFRGDVFEVRSAVRWDDGRGQLHHYELALQQVEG